MRLLITFSLTFVLWASAPGQDYTIRTFAGGGVLSNVSATSVRLTQATGVAADGAGNTYFAADAWNVVFRVDAATGQLTRFAGNGTVGYAGDGGAATSAALHEPAGVAVDAAGNVYIADNGNNVVRKVSNGVITTFAGTAGVGSFGYSGDNGPATGATLRGPTGVAVDTAGNVYIADAGNNAIRKVSNGVITTFAGNGTPDYSGDNGPATSAALLGPTGVAVDTAGNVYIADAGNNVIREVSSGVITTFAGTKGTIGYSGDNGPAIGATFDYPAGVAADGSGNVYIADIDNNAIRKVAKGVMTTFAGDGTSGYSGDNGPPPGAELNHPGGVAVDGAGNVYIADMTNNVIRKVSKGAIATLAGGGSVIFGDNGPAKDAALFSPFGVAADASGNVYIADTSDNAIRKVSDGVITTFAGSGIYGYSGDNGAAIGAALNQPYDVAADASGNVYIADTLNNVIRKVSNGVITTFAGNGCCYPGETGDNLAATSVALRSPTGVAVDSAGNVYIADLGNNVVRKVSNGAITTIAGNGTRGYSGDGGPATSAAFIMPSAVAVDASGSVYILDNGAHVIREVSNGWIATIAGNGTNGFSGDGGPATSAGLFAPAGVAVDRAGNVYISENGPINVIRKVSNGIITTIAGNETSGYSGDNGPATSAELSCPYGVAVDAEGSVYFADACNQVIRVLAPPVRDQRRPLIAK
jgi:hypothetical protein